jgi:mannose-6-phosphate isomerase-like protein (cupin superfamily)
MKPAHTRYNSAETLELFDGMQMKVLLKSLDTSGLQAVFEDSVNPGLGPGRHVHHKQDETFLFLEGTFDVEIDGALYHMHAGDTAFIPMGAAHAWKNVGNSVGRLIYIFSPALNIEDMFRDLNEVQMNGGMTEDIMKELAVKYPEQEFVGPPL